MNNKKYKLTYFNGRGRAEISRLIFAAAGVDYEDFRVQGPDWPALKPKQYDIIVSATPNGSLPLLEFNGVKVCQSLTIARYLARQFSLAGKTPVEELTADMVVACLDDLFNPLVTYALENDVDKKREQKSEVEEKLASGFANLEKILISNRGGNGYFVGGDLTWADLQFYNFSSALDNLGLIIDWSLYPKLVALKDRVGQLPQIESWVQSRPDTPI